MSNPAELSAASCVPKDKQVFKRCPAPESQFASKADRWGRNYEQKGALSDELWGRSVFWKLGVVHWASVLLRG